MNRTASDTITTATQVLTLFFWKDSSTFFCIRILIIFIGSESDDKSNVSFNWGPRKGVREAADLQKKGLRSKTFGNLWMRQRHRNGMISSFCTLIRCTVTF